MRFSDLLDRTEAKKLTQEAASELLGINVRTFQRWAERFEAEGDDGLVDRRLGVTVTVHLTCACRIFGWCLREKTTHQLNGRKPSPIETVLSGKL